MKRLSPIVGYLLPLAAYALLLIPQVAQAEVKSPANPESNQVKLGQKDLIDDLQEAAINQYRHHQYQEALKIFQEILKLRQEIKDLPGEADTLYRMAAVSNQLEIYEDALSFYQQALAIYQTIDDQDHIGRSLNSIGGIYLQLGRYDQSLAVLEEALTIRETLNDSLGIGRTLNNIASVYRYQGIYSEALKFYQQALEMFETQDEPKAVAALLNNLSVIYYQLGQYDLALETYEKTLLSFRELNEPSGEAETLNNIGLVYQEQKNYQPALEFYQKALALRRQINDQGGIGTTLNNLGLLYNDLGEYQQALEVLNQSLNIHRELGNQASEGRTLDSLGTTYKNLGENQQARQYYFAALAIHQAIRDRRSLRITLSNLGDLLLKEDQIELAIIFYKQAVNITEEIRKNLQELSTEQQQSYTETIGQTYRTLAKLLLQKVRIREAQQVLDLLKVQELDNYLRNVTGNEETAQGIELLPLESELFEFVLKDQSIAEKFNQFVHNPELVDRVEQLNRVTQGENLDIHHFSTLQQRLGNLSKTAVILYPLVLSDRLELVLVMPDYPPIYRSVPVTQAELEQEIEDFRIALTNPIERSRIKLPKMAYQSGKQLYDWLIKPIEKDLALMKIDTIIYAPDGQLRYIPLAALYDGDRWLVERYRINNITAASLTHFEPQTLSNIKMFAAAFTEGSYEFEVGEQELNLSGLEFAGEEVENIVNIIPNTTTLFNQTFNRETTGPSQLNEYDIVHFATHAAFINGQPGRVFYFIRGWQSDHFKRFRNLVSASCTINGLKCLSNRRGRFFGQWSGNSGFWLSNAKSRCQSRDRFFVECRRSWNGETDDRILSSI
jgi:CHAT domain-containing protein/Flp pilus assembly protein TadD